MASSKIPRFGRIPSGFSEAESNLAPNAGNVVITPCDTILLYNLPPIEVTFPYTDLP